MDSPDRTGGDLPPTPHLCLLTVGERGARASIADRGRDVLPHLILLRLTFSFRINHFVKIYCKKSRTL